jgi:hypothetical protein
MINSTKPKIDVNLIGKSAEVFIEYYNKNIPDSFPQATQKNLSAFQAQYPSLFEEDGQWIINKHRKKYMDWLVSHSD